MWKTTAGLATLGVAAALTLTACGSSGSGNNSSSSGGKSSGASSVQVGVILPDTTSSTRYTLYDKPLLEQAFQTANIKADVQNAQGSTSKFASIAQNMIGEGVKVLIIDSIDPQSGAGVEKQAAAAGVKVIDYDRVNLGGSAGYYVSFDNEEVGKLQAQTLVKALDKLKDPRIIMMDGGTDVDNNAVLFKKGAHEVLDPLQAQGKLKIVNEQVVKGWDVDNAAPAFQQAMTAVGGKVDGVVAANDDIANAVIGVLKTNGLAGKVAVTGQDSGVEGLQNIIKGLQTMTIFKDVKLEAAAAAKLAIALIQGTDPASAGVTLTNFTDPNSASHKIQAVLLSPAVITKANIGDVIKAGALTKAQICKGIAADCAKVGVS